jgi:hypothetical protein
MSHVLLGVELKTDHNFFLIQLPENEHSLSYKTKRKYVNNN